MAEVKSAFRSQVFWLCIFLFTSSLAVLGSSIYFYSLKNSKGEESKLTLPQASKNLGFPTLGALSSALILANRFKKKIEVITLFSGRQDKDPSNDITFSDGAKVIDNAVDVFTAPLELKFKEMSELLTSMNTVVNKIDQAQQYRHGLSELPGDLSAGSDTRFPPYIEEEVGHTIDRSLESSLVRQRPVIREEGLSSLSQLGQEVESM